MNKNKATKLINNIIERINENLKERSVCKEEIYVKTWVIGSLERIQNKIETGEVYHWISRDAQTYEKCFKDFFNNYFCLRINPQMKIYVINVLFDFDIRNMIVDLYHALFTKQQSEEILSKVRNYCGFSLNSDVDETEKYYLYEFEYLRRYFNGGVNNNGFK